MHRRHAIALVGGGVVAGIAAGCSAPIDLERAWRRPGEGETDPRRRALAWAILAPNPHNMQPWLVDLREAGEITLYVDPTRLLPVSDPFNRQIVIGSGAFLELMRMAAASDGWTAEIQPFPEGDSMPALDARPLARVRFTPAIAAVDPLFRATLARRTNRNPYKTQPVAPAIAAHIVQAARSAEPGSFGTVDPARLQVLKRLVFQGARVEAYTPAANHESAERTFFGDAELAAHPYGVALRGPVIEVAHALGLLTRAGLEREGSFAFDQGQKFLKAAADTARGFVWITTPNNDRASQLVAGAAYLRANLQATALGVAMHPWSQGLEEYSAMRETFDALHQYLAPEGGRIQMLARIGYANDVEPVPKRGVDAQIYRG